MNLVIGSTSQLSFYFPDDYIKISSRNIDKNYLKNNKWDSVYICFAEQRIYDKNIDFLTPNYYLTMELIEILLSSSNRIVVYTTSELWNNYSGPVTLEDLPSFRPDENEYVLSKFLLYKNISLKRKDDSRFNKVIIIHPFYFNSIHRKNYFLFGKIYDSIINKRKIEIGNTYFYRDITHAKYIVEESIQANEDKMVGSGRLIFVNEFIRQIYNHFDLKFEDYVVEKKDSNFRRLNIHYPYKEEQYFDLIKDTIEEIQLHLINNK